MATASNDGGVNILQVMDWRFSQIMQMMNLHSRNLNNMLSYNLEQLNTAVGKINEDINTLKRTSARDRVEIKRAVEDIILLNENWELISERLDKLEELVDMNEVDLKCCNLRFMGIPEGGTHPFPAVDVIVDILNQYSYEGSWSHRDINRAFRVGEWHSFADNPRPIVVQMHRWTDKKSILQDQDLREALRKDNIRIAAELTTRQRGMVDFHTKQGKRAYYWKGKLQVEEKQQVFDQYRFSAHGYDRRPFNYQQRREQQNQEARATADTYKNERYSTRGGWQESSGGVSGERRRADQPRVAPGHKTYSQVVKEGRPAHGTSYGDYRTSRYPSHHDKRQEQIISNKDRHKGQSSHCHVPPNAEHRRIVVKVGEQRLSENKHSRQSMSSDEGILRTEVAHHPDGRAPSEARVHSDTDTGQKAIVDSMLNSQDSAVRQTTDELHDDQLSDCNSLLDAVTPPGLDEEEQENNPGEPHRGHLPADTLQDYGEPPPRSEEDEDVPPESGSSGLAGQMGVSTEAPGRTAEVTGPDVGTGIPSRQSDTAEAGDTQGDAGAGDQSRLDTAGEQTETRGEVAVSGGESDRHSPPRAREMAKDQRLTRMATRAGSTKHRSCSQSSIRDAFKRAKGRCGSNNSDKGRDGQTSSPKCSRENI